MSSGFISGGTTENPTVRSDEWLAAQQEIEASRRRKAEEASRQQDGKTLYEVLQGNKGDFPLLSFAFYTGSSPAALCQTDMSG